MIADLIPAEPVMRLWGVICLGLIGSVLATVLLLSHALDHLARRRERAVQRYARGSPDIPETPATEPAFDPISPGSRYRIGSRLARVHQHRSSFASNTPIIGVGGDHEKQAGGA